MALVIPFTSISSICRSYFFGKQRMLPHVISNIIENIVRLVLMIILIPIIKQYGLKYIVCFLILINIISEISSTLILLLFLPKNIRIKRSDLKPSKVYIKDSLKICIPNTTSKLISSIGFFLEPIILTNILSKNYSLNYITYEYGIISGYVIPLILIPSFFTLSLSQSILPVISKESVNNNILSIRKKTNLVILLSLIIGLPVTIILLLKGDYLLQLIYHTNEGYKYIKILSIICLLEYIQTPLSSILDALNKSKDNLKTTIIGTLVRVISLFLLSYLRIGIYSLILSITLNIIITTSYQIKKVRYYLTY
jgi:stage V sporulation protein B